MRPVSAARAMAAAGFTLVEALVALAVFAIMLAIGVPSMVDWVAATKAAAASQFYVDGMTMGRSQALSHNSASRLVLTRNAASGQYDWRVDLCFPTPEAPCDDDGGEWSTSAVAVKPGQSAGAGFKSVGRSAESLPGPDRMTVTPGPDGASAVYFTPLGWVDARVATRMMRVDLAPAGEHAGFAASSVVLTLAGAATQCDPHAAADDSRGCPQ